MGNENIPKGLSRSTANFVLVACFLTGGPSNVVAQEGDPIDQLIACARIGDRSERVRCYETLGRRVLSATDAVSAQVDQPAADAGPAVPSAPTSAPASAAASTSDYSPLPEVAPIASNDTFGGERFARNENDQAPQLHAVVTSCRKDYHGDYSFSLDNGQIWKSMDSKKLRYKNCEFAVTISKEFMGYKMRVDGEWGRIRVRRIE